MTWLTVNEYLCHKLPRICFVCRNDNPVFSSFMTYHRIYNKINTTRTPRGAGCPTLPAHLLPPPVFGGV